MTRPKNFILGLAILAVVISLMTTIVIAQLPCDTETPLKLLTPVTFKLSSTGETLSNARWPATSGVTVDTTGFTIQPPVGSAASFGFGSKINLKSGIKLVFDYTVPPFGSASNKNNAGFAVMLQSDRFDQRDGANQHLGYRVKNAMAVEFDYYSNDSTDCTDVPHMSVNVGIDREASYQCGSTAYPGKNASVKINAAAGQVATVTMTILRKSGDTATTPKYTLVVNHQIAGNGANTKLLPTQDFDLSRVFDSDGGAWLSFTAAALDAGNGNVATPPIKITNLQLYTAGVDTISTITPVLQAPLTQFQSTASAKFTDVGAFNSNIILKDACSRIITSQTEEARPENLALSFSQTSTFTCNVGDFTPTIGTNSLSFPARIGCQKITSGATPRPNLVVTYLGTPKAYTIGSSGVEIISGPAIARQSTIQSISRPSGSICNTEATCSGLVAGTDGASGKPFPVQAGIPLTIVVKLLDQFSNPVNSLTYLTVSLAPKTESTSLSAIPSNSLLTVSYTPQPVVDSSTLSITVQGQALNLSKPLFKVAHGVLSRVTSTVTSGTGLPRYYAGREYDFIVSLKDAFGNDFLDTPASGTGTGQLTLQLKLEGSTQVCSTGNQVALGFELGCPGGFTVANGAATISTRPTKAAVYRLICSIGGQPCGSFDPEGFEIHVSADTEQPERTTLTTTDKRVLVEFRNYENQSGALTQNNFAPLIADGTDRFSDDNYATVGSVKTYQIASYDLFGNPRSTAINDNAPWKIFVYYAPPSAADAYPTALPAYDVIDCASSDPAQHQDGTAPLYITSASLCRYNQATGYSVQIVTKKTQYFLDVTTAGTPLFHVLIAQSGTSGQKYSKAQYSFLSQAGVMVDSTQITGDAAAATKTYFKATPVSFSPYSTAAGAVAGQFVQYQFRPVDIYGNPVKPLGFKTRAGTLPATFTTSAVRTPGSAETLAGFVGPTAVQVDATQPLFQVSHSLAIVNSRNIPSSAFPNLPGQSSSRVQWFYLGGYWTTYFLFKSSTPTTPTLYFRTGQWTAPTPIDVFPGAPYAINNKYSQTYTAAPTPLFTGSWLLYDEYSNPTIAMASFTPTPPAHTPQATGGGTIVNGAAEYEPDRLTVGTTPPTGLSVTPQKVSFEFSGGTAGSTSTFSATTGTALDSIASRTLTWPVSNNNKARAAWYRSTTTISSLAQAVAATATATPITDLTITAGDYIIARFVPDDPAKPISQALADATFSIPTYAADRQAFHSTVNNEVQNVYIVFQMTTVVPSNARLTLSAQYASDDPVTGPVEVILTIDPAFISLAHSIITTDQTMYACDDASTTAAKAQNKIKIQPKDQYSNNITTLNQSTVFLYSSALQSADTNILNDADKLPTALVNLDTSSNTYTFNICWTKAEYFPFRIGVPVTGANQVEPQLTVFAPGPLVNFQLENIQATCISTDANDKCSECVLGSSCVVRIQGLDKHLNVISPDELTTGLTLSTVDSTPATGCQRSDINIARTATLVSYGETGPADPENLVTTGITASTSGESLLISIPSTAFKYPTVYYRVNRPERDACITYKVLSLTAGSVTGRANIYLHPQPSADRYIVKVAGSTGIGEANGAGSITLAPVASIQADSQGTPVVFTMIDTLYNNWYYPNLADQLNGNFEASGTQAVPLSNLPSSGSNNAIAITTSPVFAKAGQYTLNRFTVAGTPFPGFQIGITPGAIFRWVFAFPDYGQERIADATWNVLATPYDINGNIVASTDSIPQAQALTFIVLEGPVRCGTDSTPSETDSPGSRRIANHKFSITSATHVNNGQLQLSIKTTLANTLSASGQRSQYSYFFATASGSTKTFSCTPATITVVPAAVDPVQTYVLGLETAAIRNGETLSFSTILKDRFNNTIAYDPEDTLSPVYTIQQCGAAPSTICDLDSEDDVCTIETTNGFTQADFDIMSVSAATGLYTFQIDVSGTILTPASSPSGCISVKVHHSFPSNIIFIAAFPTFDPTDESASALPDLNNIQPQTDLPYIKSIAGVPLHLDIVSYDMNGKPVDYNDSAFENTKNPENYLNFEVNQFFYRVTARFVNEIYDAANANKPASDLVYSVTADSFIPPFDTNTVSPHYNQQVILLPQWPGNYEITATIYSLAVGTAEPQQFKDKDGYSIVYSYINDQSQVSGSMRLQASSPICTGSEVYIPSRSAANTPYALIPQEFGYCEPRTPVSDFFTCTSLTGNINVIIGDYDANLADCICNAALYTTCGNRCVSKNISSILSDEDYCTSLDLIPTPDRVCPANYHLCSDRITCVETASSCEAEGRLPQCSSPSAFLCSDGSCAANEKMCPTSNICPNDTKLCPSGACVAVGDYCPQLRECNPYADPNNASNRIETFRCPLSDNCVTDLSQCPATSVCPLGYVRCPADGTCRSSLDKCLMPSICDTSTPFRCSDNSCAVDASFCPTGLSCGTITPFLCPDKKTCARDASSCNIVQACPIGTSLCSSGDCLPAHECPSVPSCHPSNPVLCINSACVATKSDCNVADAAYTPCPASQPIRCGSGQCVKDSDLCPTLIQCPFYKPILCATGQCVSASDLCPVITDTSVTQCPAGFVKCPISGSCAPFAHWCPTIRTCQANEIRCANGQCYPITDATADDLCPINARITPVCPTGSIQCPTSNTGITCRLTLQDCPGDVTCPIEAPYRCESNQCAADPADCAWASAETIPETRVPCGMGTWSSSSALCGNPPTCPSTHPAMCLDGSCKQTPADCPVNVECPTNLPFKCASGECQLNSYSCSVARCTDPKKQVRCPFHDALHRCVAHVSECQNIFDSNLSTTINTACIFGARCWDGTCVTESRLCPVRVCPAEAPFLCQDGGCKKSEAHCTTLAGCPFYNPFFCKYTAGCVKDEDSCKPSLSLNGTIQPDCPSTTTIDPDTGATVVVPSTQILCSDGTCRATQDDCLTTGPFGCAPETPLRCADGSCVARPTDANPVSSCKLASDVYNACPASRPIRCPGGMCSTSLSRCPSYPSLTSSTQENGICGKLQRQVQDPNSDDKEKMITVTEYMTITCDDGSCAFSQSECPIIKPCKNNEFRCGDGTCRAAACDLSQATCRRELNTKNYLGASCPAVNTCPGQLPYRCQSGECATDRTQCISNFPIVLNKCCGSSATYSAGTNNMNPQGEDLGTCTDSTLPCVDTPRTIEDTTNKGCPQGTVRCSRGQCVPSVSSDDLCAVYDQAFDQLATQEQTCISRCPSGQCVDDPSQCTTDNGCPVATPLLCSTGRCVSSQSQCAATTACTLKCPNNGVCVDDLKECVTPLGCPLSTPVLCADGTCKAKPATQSDMTVQPYPDFKLVGIAADVCKPTMSCSGFTPYLCADGSCQSSPNHCAPIMASCPGICRVTCPLTNTCTQLQSLVIGGMTVCDFDSLIDQCNTETKQRNEQTEQCPAARPFLCQSGQCVQQPTECSSPFFNAARTENCPAEKPLRCVDGSCASRPFDCITATALIAQTTAETPSPTPLEPFTHITNTNACKRGYVCPNGLCVTDSTKCSPIPSCLPGSKRCEDGSCALPGVSGTTVTEPECLASDLDKFKQQCSGGVRCADGLCRSTGTCPPSVDACQLGEISCPWSLKKRCVKSASECPGYFPADDSDAMTVTSRSLSLLSTGPQSLSVALKLDQLSATFPQLSQQSIASIITTANSMITTSSSFNTLATATTAISPQDDSIETCYQDCERDLTATASTTIVTPTTNIHNLAISNNRYSLPRSTVSIPAGAVNRTAEFRVYPTPESFFTTANVATLQYSLPFVVSEPEKKRAKEIVPNSAEFAGKVISTPFACSLQVNNTAIQPALALALTSYVDTKTYAVTQGGDADIGETEFPCAYTGNYDSALIGSGCGGSISITGSTITVDYSQQQCGWTDVQNVLSFKASMTSVKSLEEVAETIEWNGQTAHQVICMRVDSSTRKFASGASIIGTTFCATFIRITDLVQIILPDNLMVLPPSYTTAPATLPTENQLTEADFTNSLTTPPSDTELQTISNTLFYDPTSASSATQCATTSSDVSQIPKQDICLGFYDYEDYTWKCLKPLNEERLASPTWTSGMKLNQATASLENCNAAAYAFLNIPLPDPVPVEDDFCFWCEYGWIILLVCIIFVVVLLIVILLALKFYRDRIKYKQEQKKLKGLQEHAQDLAENQGGLGVADADGEINMTINPLVLQLQDLNKQLEDANLKLDTVGKEEEYHIQRLQQQRQRIQAEIKRLEESLAHDESARLAPKRIEAPTAGAGGPSATGAPQGPVRTGGAGGATGPSTVGGASGPMRAPPK